MAQTEATVASGVKNRYINFVSNSYEVVGNANWCQNNENFGEIGVFRLQGFPSPPQGPKKKTKNKKCWFFWCPGGVA